MAAKRGRTRDGMGKSGGVILTRFARKGSRAILQQVCKILNKKDICAAKNQTQLHTLPILGFEETSKEGAQVYMH
jgi:hypothetical protein